MTVTMTPGGINTGITANKMLHLNSDLIESEYYGFIEGCNVHYSQVNRQIGNWYATGGLASTNAEICTVIRFEPLRQKASSTAVSLGMLSLSESDLGERCEGSAAETERSAAKSTVIYGTIPGR